MGTNELALIGNSFGNFETITRIPGNQPVIARGAQPCAACIFKLQYSCQKSGPKTRVLKVRMDTYVMQSASSVDQCKSNHDTLVESNSRMIGSLTPRSHEPTHFGCIKHIFKKSSALRIVIPSQRRNQHRVYEM